MDDSKEKRIQPSPWELDTVRQYAENFARFKGRCPKDRDEFVEWLLEYGHMQNSLFKAMETAFKEHLNTCARAIVIPGDFLK